MVMENKMLFADETLDGFSQDGANYSTITPGFEIVKFDTSNEASLETDHSIGSTAKRKREEEQENLAKVKIEKRHKSKEEFFPCEVEMKHKRNQGLPFIEDVVVSESCSLFNSVTLSWKLGISSVSTSTTSFTKNTELNKSNSKNGIWLNMNFSKKDQHTIGKDLVVLLELYETYLQSDSSRDQLVQFCNGKCRQKKNEVIELHELNVTANCKGYFEAAVAVNEQCAHRSDNDYGSPRTRFYFLLKFFDKAEVVTGQETPFFVAKSNQLKVVAPGKAAKPPQPKKTKASKLTLQQSMETIIHGLEKFDERLSRFESSDATQKLEQLEARVTAVETYISHLPSLIQQMVERSVQEAINKQSQDLLAFYTSPSRSPSRSTSLVKDNSAPLPADEDFAGQGMSPSSGSLLGFDFPLF